MNNKTNELKKSPTYLKYGILIVTFLILVVLTSIYMDVSRVWSSLLDSHYWDGIFVNALLKSNTGSWTALITATYVLIDLFFIMMFFIYLNKTIYLIRY